MEMKLLLKPNLTFERFRQLCESLEDDDKSTFCGSLKSFYSLLQYRLRSIYAPARNLSVSEIQFRSASSQQSSFPLLNDMTRADGVQLFQLHDSRGFVLDFHLESRAILNRKDSRAKVVKKLIKSRLDVGHAIYLNSSFCSVALAHSLALRQTYLNGTFTPSQCDNLPLETFDLRTDSMAVQSEGVFIAKSAKSHLCTISTEFASDCFEKYKNGLKSIYPQDFVHCENESFNHDFYLDLRVFTHFLKIISQNAYVLYKFDTPPSSMLFQSFQSDIFKKLPL